MTPNVLIVYRNFAAQTSQPNPASHVGLGINALHTARMLRKAGIAVDVAGVWTPDDVRKQLAARPGVNHCLIEAPWIATTAMSQLLASFPHIKFVTRCHSQIGFLQVEAGAIKLFRDAAVLQDGSLNFHVAGNSGRFSRWFSQTYRHACAELPNLYDAERQMGGHKSHQFRNVHRVRIGSFGALRLMKNHTTAAAAALLIGRMNRLDVEFHISVNREEHGKGVLQSLRNMFAGLNWAKLVEVPWASWPEFRNLIGTMDLAIQLSHSETFNIVTADAVSEGVPSVVSDAIEWAPASWIAPVDDATRAAEVGTNLLHNAHSTQAGIAALNAHNTQAIGLWKGFLGA